ncbi:MAG: alpha/beta hydrolase [Selenomonadaceae bacterium]|nr:alpha/beta hydrolase [Selenomonadaceae bacterium]
MRKKFLALAAALALNFSPVSAAPAWTMPDSGVQLYGKAKQTYVAETVERAYTKQNPDNYFSAPDGWNYEIFNLGKFNLEYLENPAGNPNRVVLQLHGGGYVLALTNGHRNLAVKYGVLADAAKIYSVDYRIAPENIYPAALEDAVTAYKEILRRGTKPEEIIVTGDSAGGNLTVALSLYLRENNLPQPKMLILVSPWATAQNNLPSRKYNATRDLILGKGTPLYEPVTKPSAYAKGLKAKDPRISVVYADLKNLPPMLIQAGGYELFLDECVELAKKAAADNVKVTLTVYPEMSHDFALLLPDLQDTLDSFREIQDFINQNMD